MSTAESKWLTDGLPVEQVSEPEEVGFPITIEVRNSASGQIERVEQARAWVDVWSPLLFGSRRNQGITAPPGTPLRHRHRRANFNKHARHTKRPNGRPKHR